MRTGASVAGQIKGGAESVGPPVQPLVHERVQCDQLGRAGLAGLKQTRVRNLHALLDLFGDHPHGRGCVYRNVAPAYEIVVHCPVSLLGVEKKGRMSDRIGSQTPAI